MAIRESIEAEIRREREYRDNPDIVSIVNTLTNRPVNNCLQRSPTVLSGS